MAAADLELIKSLLKPHPDFPKKGIVFLDIFPILRNPIGFETLVTHFVHHLTSSTVAKAVLSSSTSSSEQSGTGKIDVVVGLDARGFLIGPIIALRLGGSAKAAGELVEKLGGKTLEYLFIVELTFLKGSEKLNAPVYSMVQVDD
ncbi:adenine phosphoribosyltransferase [Tulasnella sp. 418]|nr:adenine phosphoribosyltransferase [Tulasnella sp. 418]